MYFFVTMVKRLSKQRPLIADCNASINSKREHVPLREVLVKSLPSPRVGRFCENTPPSRAKILDKTHPRGKFFTSFTTVIVILALLEKDFNQAFSAVSEGSIFNVDAFIARQINLLFQKWLHFNFAHL